MNQIGNVLENLPEKPLDYWLADFKPYQKNHFNTLNDQYGTEKAIELWLSSSGSGSTAGFGGEGRSSDMYDHFMSEFRKLICGDEEYAEIREQIKCESPLVQSSLISFISSKLGEALGVASVSITIAVAALLYIIGKVGIRCWCEIDKNQL